MSEIKVTNPEFSENPEENQVHEPALEETSGAEELPIEGARIYLKVPMRDHVELTVISVESEDNPNTENNDTAIYFHDGSKLYASDFTKDGYSWAPVPQLPFGAEPQERKDETEED